MKNILFCLVALCLLSTPLQAQIPNKFNYQAVAKTAGGAPITGVVKVQFTIFDGSATGAEVYKEEHAAVTADANGLFSVQIGGGQAAAGSNWSNINWSSDAKYLKVEIQQGTGSYVQVGEPQELVSVPYAQIAGTSLTDKDQQTLAVSGHTLSIANGNTVTLPDDDKQTLTASGHTLSITNGNSITLPDDDKQTLTLSGNTLSIINGNSVTIPAQFWTANGNNISNTNSGNIGIKTSSPLAPLHIKSDGNGGVGGVQLLLEENNDADGARLQFKNTNPSQYWDIWGYTNTDESLARMNLHYNNGTAGKDVVSLTGYGDVGVGTTNPDAKFDVRGNTKGAIYAETGAAADALVGRYTGTGGWSAISGHCNSPEGNAMWGNNYSTGRGGLIGGKFYAGHFWGGGVRIEGITALTICDYAYYDQNPPLPPFLPPSPLTGGQSGCVASDYSIFADGYVAANGFVAFSDRRIKNITGISNSRNDLEILNKIQITDYFFKDPVSKGFKPQKKVIGQQVAEVFPQAVSTDNKEIVPDIMQMAVAEKGWIALKDCDLKRGDKVRLIFEQGKEELEVTEVTSEGFRVASDKSGEVFVYGREVSDFHIVDYEAIAMLNVSATQELAKQVTGLKKQLADRDAQLTAAMTMLQALQQDVAALKAERPASGGVSHTGEK